MDDFNNDNQPLDSMGEPISPLGSHPVNPLAPDNNMANIPRNPLAPEPGEMPMNSGMQTNGGMPPRNPLAPEPGEMPMNSGMPANNGMPMDNGMPMNSGMQQGYSQPMNQGYGRPMGRPMGQPMMQQNPMMYNQPVDSYGPAMMDGSMGGGYSMGGTKKNSKLFPIIMIGVALVLFVVLLILPKVLPSGGSGGSGEEGGGGSSENGGENGNENGNNGGGTSTLYAITREKVANYCLSNGYKVEQGTATDVEHADGIYTNATEFVMCDKSTSAYNMISYVKVDGKILEDEYVKDFKSELLTEGSGIKTVVSETDHQEYVTAENFTYVVFHDDVIFVAMAPDTDTFETILTGVRGENELNKKYKDIVDRKVFDENTSSLRQSQRDTARRNDISRVDTSLVQYQTNNNTKSINLPGAGIYVGKEDFEGANNCSNTDTACLFVRDYMNSTSLDTKNGFTDPDGTPYSVLITDNWAKDASGTLGVITFNENSRLIEKDGGYTLGGINPFPEHVIYIVPGSRCDGQVVKQTTKRHFAILYQLEGTTGPYCLDDQ